MKETAFQLAERQLAALTVAKTDAEKPIMLMLHGWQDNAASFSHLFPQLQDHYRLYALDWPGHGYSERRDADNYYHFFDYVDDLHQVVLQLNTNKVYVVGHSLGALVASTYAAAFPENVLGLVLIEGLSPLYEAPENTAQRLRQGILSRQRYRQRSQRKPRRKMVSFEQALMLRCQVNQLDEALLRPIVKRGVEYIEGGYYWRHDERLRCDSLYRIAQEHAQATMSAIACPVLSIVGEHGFPRLQQRAPELGWVKNIQQQRVEGGHHCHLESPQAVCDSIVAFTSKIDIQS
ncbi:alpha/beta hydrolase [Photobacterium swingsii]|uniref:Alpha/beta hydrolase n=1 Tax=Photobacterium swingsii TaxID=680026 RepID=A0A0J8VDW7_9GAMM|nr:alpha/beta hydrolase [Photobacterium swingsii]KMV30705.1 hydrolase [Photobacterium swingsii]PSW26705.1 alpha/beta hydrolase [Photobacterium swingsii]